MDDNKRRIYVGSLSFKTDEESLRELCEKYGTIEDGMALYFTLFLCVQSLWWLMPMAEAVLLKSSTHR